MDEGRPEIESRLCDVTGVDLDTLRRLDNPVLAASIARILREADLPDEALSGFSNSI